MWHVTAHHRGHNPRWWAHVSALQSFIHVPLGKSLTLNLNFMSASPACRVSWDAGDRASCTSHPAHSMGPQLPASPDSAPSPPTPPTPDTQTGQDPLFQTPVISIPRAASRGDSETHAALLHHRPTGMASVPATAYMVSSQPSASGHYGGKEAESGGTASPAQ